MIARTTIQARLTVEQIAAAFAELHSDEQAAFFGHVQRAAVAKGWWAEQQWHYMCGHISAEPWLVSLEPELAKDARESLMSMAAPLYLHTLRYCEARP